MARTSPKGPWLHRFLVYGLTVLFGLLVYWLLGFVVDDIGTWPGPDYAALEERMLDPALKAEAERLDKEIAETQRAVATEQARQGILRDSTDNAQRTMNQLLEFQKLSLEKGVTPSAEEQAALAESQKRFLTNQTQYQEISEEIARLQERSRELEEEQRANRERLDEARKPIQAEHERLLERHNLVLAGLKLAFLIPLLVLAAVAFIRMRTSAYVPLVAAFAIAVAAKVMLVMHEHFPTRYFKYVLILTLLAIVTKILVSLIRTRAFPKADWLRKQFREAYEAHLCPICEYPIRRGPLKFLYWTRRTIKRLPVPRTDGAAIEEPYSCPSCGTRLFEECSACHAVRHSLLPTCEHCGATQPVEPAAAATILASDPA
ncbi:MAG: hypothetical protein WD069_07305 [Planctomycetales bacterium]